MLSLLNNDIDDPKQSASPDHRYKDKYHQLPHDSLHKSPSTRILTRFNTVLTQCIVKIKLGFSNPKVKDQVVEKSRENSLVFY